MQKIIAFVCLCCIGSVGKCDSPVSAEDRLRAQQLVDGFAESAYSLPIFACFGTRERANFEAIGPNSPLSTVSDFIVCVDTEQRFRRNSILVETIDPSTDQLSMHGWLTRETTNGQAKVYRDTRLGKDVEFETRRLIVSDLDPWQLCVASTSDISQNRCQPGFMENICRPGELVELVNLKGVADVATFQVGSVGRLTIVFSAEFDFMPTIATWRVSKKTVDPNADDEYSLLVSETQTRWKKFEKTWLPMEYQIRQFAGGKNAVSNLAIRSEWCIGRKAEKAKVASVRADDLYQYLTENAVKMRPSKKAQ